MAQRDSPKDGDLKRILESLEQIARLAKNAKDAGEIEAAIKSARRWIQDEKISVPELDNELAIWQSKLSVIFKEPIGRQGMAKHALHWIEKLSRANVK